MNSYRSFLLLVRTFAFVFDRKWRSRMVCGRARGGRDTGGAVNFERATLAFPTLSESL